MSSVEKKCFNSELLLDFNDFNQQSSLKNLEALAKVFQNIILFRQGNFPNQPNLGVGIQDYEFEFLDNITKTNLEHRIKKQCQSFAPNDAVYDVKLETLKLKNNSVALAVLFFITDEGEKKNPTFAITFNKEKRNGRLVSRILI